MATNSITQARLKNLLRYDPDTGIFTWLVKRGRADIGGKAGAMSRGYVVIRINGINYPAHRLAWVYTYGDMPPHQIDHINQNRSDNRKANLRMATNAQNHQNRGMSSNNSSGHTGVNWHKLRKKWRAFIKVNGKDTHLGLFTDLDAAIAARKQAELLYHPFKGQC